MSWVDPQWLIALPDHFCLGQDSFSPWPNIRRRARRWLVDQHWTSWRSLGDTKRRARELISGPCLGAKARFLSFNGTESRAVTGLLTGHNNLRRHLHLIGLSDSTLCRRCGAEDETSAHIRCEYEALVHTDMCIWAPSSWSHGTLRV